MDERLLVQEQGLVQELESSRFYFWSFILRDFSHNFNGYMQLVGVNGVVQFSVNEPLIGKGGNEVSKALARAMKGELKIP